MNCVKGHRGSHRHRGFERPRREYPSAADRNKQDIVGLQRHVGNLRFQHLLDLDLRFGHPAVRSLANDARGAELGRFVRSPRQGQRLQNGQRSVIHQQSARTSDVSNHVDDRRPRDGNRISWHDLHVRRILLAAFGSNDFDGFELNLALLPGEVVAAESLDAPAGRRSSHSFHWNKPGRANSLDNSSAWTIALDLLSSANRQRGTLTMYRLYSTRDLQLDVNLLTGAFPTALADALDRTLVHSAEVIALPEQDSSLVTAQAG